jgi:hypothetical protein
MHMRSNIHTASTMMNTDFRDMISCSLVEINQLFRGEYCLYFQSRNLQVVQVKALASPEILVNLYQAS